MKILVTGATGFIGSNIVKELFNLGHEIYATHRTSSSFQKVIALKSKVNWINTDSKNWKETIKASKIDQLIHVAWGGIEAGDRNNWDLQIKNFSLSKDYFDLAKECGFSKVIGFGSQAEYGLYDLPSSELTLPKPNDAYGAVKLMTYNYLRSIFLDSETAWYWIRVYSVFGDGENPQWLIPSVISTLLKKEDLRLTECEQEYNYLHIEDFVNYFIAIVEDDQNQSGVYNICNKQTIILKDLLNKIAEILQVSSRYLKFGVIPYRNPQSMFISGTNSKFMNYFPKYQELENNLTDGLIKTIRLYKK
jgi:nucleoside-diphosphate-sugar epimerase